MKYKDRQSLDKAYNLFDSGYIYKIEVGTLNKLLVPKKA